MIKELFEDIHRMKGDYNMNNRKSNLYSLATGNIKQTKTWRNIKMGEILEIKKDEEHSEFRWRKLFKAKRCY